MHPRLAGEDRLAISVTHADGRVTRWGPDEPDAVDIPGDLSFGTQIPGGFKDLSCSLLRRLDLNYADLSLFDSVRVYGAGNRTAWEGRMVQFPRTHGDGFSITPGAVGWSAHLTDDPTFTEVYVDRDPSHWGAPPSGRLGAVLGSVGMGDFSWSQTNAALTAALPTNALGTQTLAEAWYQMPPGLKVAAVLYAGQGAGALTGWLERFVATDTEAAAVQDGYSWTLNGALQTISLSTPRRYAFTQLYSNGTGTTPALGTYRRLDQVGVYGNHALTLRAISGQPSGVYASDVVRDVVTRAAPLLTIGEIEPTTFAVPHLVYSDPTTGEAAIQFVNAYHGFDWGAYDNRTFFYRPSDPSRLTWQARLSEGARLDLEGDTAEQVFNGVYVTYQDPSGKRKTVGPPGASADATSSSLADTSETNPVNAHGIPRRWGMLEISQVTTEAGAIQLGAIWLAEHAAPQRRGTLTLTGSVTHPTEGKAPVWRVRAGDYIAISDHPADLPRKIIETRYTHGSRQVVCNLDNTPFLLDALLQRFGAGLVGVL